MKKRYKIVLVLCAINMLFSRKLIFKTDRLELSISVYYSFQGLQVNNDKYVVCATSKASDQLAHMHSLIRAFASRLNIL